MAAQVSKLTQAVRETPDIRVERVQQIKEQIANGSYNFNDPQILEQVADRIANFLLRK
jgi:flagellar biosynthesis anti-sigma factor FlgM